MSNWLKLFFAAVVLALWPQADWGAEHGSASGVAAAAAHAGGAAAHETHGLPSAPPVITQVFGLPITNSMVVTWVAALGVIVFARRATKKIEDVPGGLQNFWEWLVEGVYGFLEGIVGKDLVKRTFWFFATVFIFILFSNWLGLVPGVGTIGWGTPGAHGFQVTEPWLRGVNADLNMTFGMAMFFFLMWTIWALQVNGVKGFLLHLFGPKGDMRGFMRILMIVVFIAVGVLEVVTILFRPVTLSFRLYGNIFAGENMLESMAMLVQDPPWLSFLASCLIPIPFYFLEVLVGLVQALVFMLLTSVFTLLICMHDEGHATAHH
jgi:F-type H+-transporting ATPase subunit a